MNKSTINLLNHLLYWIFITNHQECAKIPEQKPSYDNLLTELSSIKERVAKLEKALDEKDSELREMSILRGEYIEHLNTIRNLLKKVVLRPHLADQLNSKLEQRKFEVLEPEESQSGAKEILKVPTLETESEKTTKSKTSTGLDMLETTDSDRLDLTEDPSYRERMILMNRIDIYRLFITVIIISGEIKYPRALTSVEEREMKMFIEQLNEFENMVLDVGVNENIIWEQGKACEKHILQLFTNFFKV